MFRHTWITASQHQLSTYQNKGYSYLNMLLCEGVLLPWNESPAASYRFLGVLEYLSGKDIQSLHGMVSRAVPWWTGNYQLANYLVLMIWSMYALVLFFPKLMLKVSWSIQSLQGPCICSGTHVVLFGPSLWLFIKHGFHLQIFIVKHSARCSPWQVPGR